MVRFLFSAVLLVTLSGFGSAARAAVVADHQFDTLGDTQGWSDRGIGSGTDRLTADGASLTAVSPGADPQLLYADGLERAADAQWDTVVFRIRETESPGGEPIVFDPTGSVVQINSGGRDGLLVSKPADFAVEDSGDGFYTVTVSIAKYQDAVIDQLRLDPIGGTLKNSNSDTAGNTFEIDFIQVTDTSSVAVSEPE